QNNSMLERASGSIDFIGVSTLTTDVQMSQMSDDQYLEYEDNFDPEDKV
ncbi:hypothetical protein Tco_1239981, partial [Tanacetum coccineum]